MASISLPRVLQQRKSSLEIERENFEKDQTVSISKAINTVEAPVKSKHVRRAIIGTFHEKGAHTFWHVAVRLPIQDNRICAWKFCHVLHKLLREGHPNCVQNSQKHAHKLEDLGRLWMHLRESYGKLIQLYCTLLITKLKFHKRNPRFPGNLTVTADELEVIGENDINVYFQLSVELFDYMDDLLALQKAVYGSLDMSRSTSMTSSGQCRMAPLIPCIQDAAKIYDYSVKILYKLHSALPPDVLDGHRKRFLTQFRELSTFYRTSATRQFFQSLITIPHLPENPPNFLIQAELRTYVTPEVIVPDEPPDTESTSEGTLIDTSDQMSTMDATSTINDAISRNGSVSPTDSAADVLAEKDSLIDYLQQEIGSIRLENQKTVGELKLHLINLNEKLAHAESELAARDSELSEERKIKEELFQQAHAHAQQTQDPEQKTREEKFNRLVELYKQLREEHVQLLRQAGDTDKQLKKTTRTKLELEEANKQLETRVSRTKTENDTLVNELQQSVTMLTDEITALKSHGDFLTLENTNLQAQARHVTGEKSTLEREIDTLRVEKDDLDRRLKEKERLMDGLNGQLTTAKSLNQASIAHIYTALYRQCRATLAHYVEEINEPKISELQCGPDYFRHVITHATTRLNDLNAHSNNDRMDVCTRAFNATNAFADLLVMGKAMANVATNILFGEQILDECKKLEEGFMTVLERAEGGESVSGTFDEMFGRLGKLLALVDQVSGQLQHDSAENLVDLMDKELASMDKAIDEASKKIEDMLNKSRKADSGVKLEVNEKILDSCTTLMAAIRELVKKSRLLQAEIALKGKGSVSAKEFYKRNHKWTEGLISAAKAVGTGAKFLLSAADQVIGGQGKFELLVVGAQEIAASTAQLVVASRVKADRNSENLHLLSDASRAVTSATGGVVATVKSCRTLIEENEEFDTSGVSLHETKRLEMESQVRVLELEQSLEQERQKLSQLRKHHYQLAGEMEGWDIIEKDDKGSTH